MKKNDKTKRKSPIRVGEELYASNATLVVCPAHLGKQTKNVWELLSKLCQCVERVSDVIRVGVLLVCECCCEKCRCYDCMSRLRGICLSNFPKTNARTGGLDLRTTHIQPTHTASNG